MKHVAVICLLLSLSLLCILGSGCSINVKPAPTPEAAAPVESALTAPDAAVTPAPTPDSPPEAETDIDPLPELKADDNPSQAGKETDDTSVTATTAPTSVPTTEPSVEAEISTGNEPEAYLPSSYDASGGAIELPEIEID